MNIETRKPSTFLGLVNLALLVGWYGWKALVAHRQMNQRIRTFLKENGFQIRFLESPVSAMRRVQRMSDLEQLLALDRAKQIS